MGEHSWWIRIKQNLANHVYINEMYIFLWRQKKPTEFYESRKNISKKLNEWLLETNDESRLGYFHRSVVEDDHLTSDEMEW